MMFVLVTALVLIFRSSAALSNAYGIAVSGTLAADTILFLAVLRGIKHKSYLTMTIIGIIFIPIDLLFISSNSLKIFHGGLFPILIGLLIYIVINTWTKGEKIIDSERHAIEGPLQKFVDDIYEQQIPLRRIPGAGIFIGHHPKFVPLAFRDMVIEQHELPEKAHVSAHKRFVFDDLGHKDGISHILLQYGYHDAINIPREIAVIDKIDPELSFDIDTASYLVSLTKVVQTKRNNLAKWRKSLYCLLYRNALIISDYYKLPVDRTEEISTPIEL
jgi:KUP system potassium uptake protein